MTLPKKKKEKQLMRFPEFILEEAKNEEEDLKNYLLHVYRDALIAFPEASKKKFGIKYQEIR